MNQTIEPMLAETVQFEKNTLKPKTIRAAVVDNDDALRAELAELIGADPSFAMVRHCPDADSALNELPRFKPDVVLLDITLPGMDGIECMRRLKAQMPGT